MKSVPTVSLIDSRVVAEDESGQPAPHVDVAAMASVTVVEGTAIIGAQVSVIPNGAHIAGASERVTDPARPSIRQPLLQRHFQRVVVGIESLRDWY